MIQNLGLPEKEPQSAGSNNRSGNENPFRLVDGVVEYAPSDDYLLRQSEEYDIRSIGVPKATRPYNLEHRIAMGGGVRRYYPRFYGGGYFTIEPLILEVGDIPGTQYREYPGTQYRIYTPIVY